MIAQIVVKLKYSSAYPFTLNLVLINSHYRLLEYSQKIHHWEDVKCWGGLQHSPFTYLFITDFGPDGFPLRWGDNSV